MDQVEAKEFFAQRVIRQAESEGIPLTPAERYMLYWTETGPGCDLDEELLEQYDRETNDQAFEAKVGGLFQRAFERDAARGDPTVETYKQAHAALSEGDHYILVMIDATIGSKIRKKKWFFF